MEICLKSKSTPKLERKYVEKNRRNHMKNLCNQLHSMLTTHPSTSKETTMAVPDQIDVAIKYIESLKMKLEKSKKQLGPKRAQSLNATNELGPTTMSPSEIEFHEMGPNMVMVLITSLNNIATFNNIIRLCHEEGVEIVSTSFKLNGNSTLQISHETKINKTSRMEFRATSLCEKMKELIYGPSYENDVESQLHLWDYKIEYDALELLPTKSTTQNPNLYCYMQNVI